MKNIATKDYPPQTKDQSIVVGSRFLYWKYPEVRPWKNDNGRLFDIYNPRNAWWFYMGSWGVRLAKIKGSIPNGMGGSLRPDLSAVFVGHPKVLEKLALS